MEALVATLSKRARGGVGRKEERLSVEVLKLGRGTDNEIYLPDPRVPLHIAVVHKGNDGLFIEATGTHDLRINGAIGRTKHISPGDIIGVGPYELKVEEPGDGLDVALSVELIHPMGDDIEELLGRSCTSIAQSGINKRAAAWILALVVFTAFLVIPIAMRVVQGDSWARVTSQSEGGKTVTRSGVDQMAEGHRSVLLESAWNTGEMTDAHKFFAEDCGACHTKPFVMVQDGACMACHVDQRLHAEMKHAALTGLDEMRCASCHTEHQGPQPVRASSQSLCSSCHNDLNEELVSTKLANVTDFGFDHPQFKPTISTNPGTNEWKRISLDDKPQEVSNLKFSHAAHLDPTKMKDPQTGKTKQLGCASCHLPSIEGEVMQPIDMETHCASCHRLNFDKIAPERTVSHGKPDIVYRELKEFYAALALKGGVPEETAPAVVRRRPGTELAEEERLEALGWAEKKASAAAHYVFSKSQCGTCHTLKNVGGDPVTVDMDPVFLTRHWQPKASFDHSAHKDVSCSQCHKVTESKVSNDVLLPGIETCRTCHGGEKATALIPSTCIDCHQFHRTDLDRMSSVDEEAKQ